MALRLENYEAAERLAREYCDDLRLLLDDLGIGRGSGAPVALTTPPDVLRRVLPRLRELAEGLNASHEPAWLEARQLRTRNLLVAEACTTVLSDL